MTTPDQYFDAQCLTCTRRAGQPMHSIMGCATDRHLIYHAPPDPSIQYEDGQCVSCTTKFRRHCMAVMNCELRNHNIYRAVVPIERSRPPSQRSTVKKRPKTKRVALLPVGNADSPPPGMVTSRVMAERWDVTLLMISKWCRDGRFPGAQRLKLPGRRIEWYIPTDAIRPPRRAKSAVTPNHAPPQMVSLADMAKRWGVSHGLLSRWCRNGRFPGAVQITAHRTRGKWYIPENAERPPRLSGDDEHEDRNDV